MIFSRGGNNKFGRINANAGEYQGNGKFYAGRTVKCKVSIVIGRSSVCSAFNTNGNPVNIIAGIALTFPVITWVLCKDNR